ncbi:hypothetical protein CHA01nite_24070 [Chryseobacterium hagamense]|uniref:Uncharacterized protein n=1 Tax=Chryseobacterium hagamense TaxID=395935 RepID=A0A511YN94_9FLAO|nr:hypothetical protein CHA01nite_24070 [Chryseobacterium hagamense]
MLEIIGTVFSHDVFGIPDIIDDVVAEKDVVIHLIDVKLIHAVHDAVYMNPEKIAPGEQFTVVVCLFFDSLPLDIIAFEKEKDADEGNTRQNNE